MSLKKNTIANYIGQGYTTLIGIVILPFYLRYLGAEAYGLVGFFAVMQSWLQLLDMGLSSTLSRQVAHSRGLGSERAAELRQLLRSMELVFLALGVAIAIAIWIGSPLIAGSWLDVKMLSLSEVRYCISLMGVMIGLRWLTSLYRSGIQGMEHQVWLNVVNIVLTTVRYFGVWCLLHWITRKPEHFFEFQLLISLVELGVIGIHFYQILPPGSDHHCGFSWKVLKAVLPFTGSIAYTSSIWILMTQLDKLILSHALTLEEYGYFALVAVVSNGILNFTGPITNAILPRMTMLHSQGNQEEMLALYRKATRLMAAIMLPLTGTVAIFSTELLYSWTGDRSAADWAGPVLKWFVLGNCILALGGFQYMLQFVHGKLRLHVIISTINVIIQVPIIVFSAFKYGAIGVALTYLIFRSITFFIWPTIVHYKLAPGLHNRWLLFDIFPSFIPVLLLIISSHFIFGLLYNVDRVNTFVILLISGFVTISLNMLIFKLQEIFND